MLERADGTIGRRGDEQRIALGPAASQVAIKQLGTNGGGFFNVNSAHPFENPTPLSNFLELLAILAFPPALCYTFGGWSAIRGRAGRCSAAMTVLFLARARGALRRGGAGGQSALAALGVDAARRAAAGRRQHGGQGGALRHRRLRALGDGHDRGLERLGQLDARLATRRSAGSSPMWLMQLGEVIFGGVGSGLYGMLVFAIIAVFVAGLMVGRTPEYLGKKIEAFEMKMASLVIL